MHRPLSHVLVLGAILIFGLMLLGAWATGSLRETLFQTAEERQLASVQTQIQIERAQWELEQERAARLQASVKPATEPATDPPLIAVGAIALVAVAVGLAMALIVTERNRVQVAHQVQTQARIEARRAAAEWIAQVAAQQQYATRARVSVPVQPVEAEIADDPHQPANIPYAPRPSIPEAPPAQWVEGGFTVAYPVEVEREREG